MGVMAFSKKNYDLLREQLTPEKIKAHYKDLVHGEVDIYEMPNIDSLQVVMHNALGGGATNTLRWDETGKSMCLGMLYLDIEVPEGFELAEEP